MKKNSTDDVITSFVDSPGLYDYTGGNVSGNTVQDILQIGKIKFNYKFIAASHENDLQYTYLNGLVTLDRDYMLASYTSLDEEKDPILNVNLLYDLGQGSKDYKYPSNKMIDGYKFDIKAYGIYLQLAN
ncbi:hypothetical protein ABPG72_015585 [Tetrahymena utriculariae]